MRYISKKNRGYNIVLENGGKTACSASLRLHKPPCHRFPTHSRCAQLNKKKID